MRETVVAAAKVHAQFGLALGAAALGKASGGAHVLTYHAVGAAGPRLRFTRPAIFRAHIRLLARRGYRSVLARDLACHWADIVDDPHAVVLTFDDGLACHRDIACPVLEENGFRGVFFVPTGCIARERRPAPDAGLPEYGRWTETLCWDDVREIGWAGHEVGAHSLQHVAVTALPRRVAANAVAQARTLLLGEAGCEAVAFAYPKGREGSFAGWTGHELRKAGYSIAFTTMGGPAAWAPNAMEIPRNDINGLDSLLRLQLKLSGYYDPIYRARHRRRAAAAGA